MGIEIRKMSSAFVFAAALAAVATSLTGCGKQEFTAVGAIEAQQAPGYFVIPPKVDILVSIDNTGSMAGSLYNSVKASLPNFLGTLEAKNWDYHLAAIPLVTDKSVNHVTASHHDSNYGSLWTPPFPGALPTAPGMIVPAYFLPLTQFLNTELIAAPDNTQNGSEPGLKTLMQAFNTRLPQTGFMRQDALLVILALSSGEDTSDVILCRNADGYMTPYENRRTAVSTCYLNGTEVPVPTAGTLTSSFSAYEQQIKALKTSPSQVKFYSAVNTTATGPYAPSRYMNMASSTGGASYSINNVGQVLDSLSQSLQAQRLSIRTRYLFISDQPELASIQVTKYVNGSQATVIPQDATNGWTYAGWLDNVYAIDSPVPMNLTSGYAIELHGTAKLQGDDTADIAFHPAGVQSTH